LAAANDASVHAVGKSVVLGAKLARVHKYSLTGNKFTLSLHKKHDKAVIKAIVMMD